MAQDTADLDLENFLTFRLETLSYAISRSIAAVLEKRFDLTLSAWRVMVVVARYPGVSAGAVAKRAQMDKVAVSRAVNRLIEAGRIDRETDDADRRRSVLKLSEQGRELYDRVAPMALRMEADLLAEVTEGETDMVRQTIDKLSAKAEHFAKPYLSPLHNPDPGVYPRRTPEKQVEPMRPLIRQPGNGSWRQPVSRT